MKLFIFLLLTCAFWSQSRVIADSPRIAMDVKMAVSQYLEAVAQGRSEAISAALSHSTAVENELADAYANKVSAYRGLLAVVGRSQQKPTLPSALEVFTDDSIASLRRQAERADVVVENDTARVGFPGRDKPGSPSILLVREGGAWRLSTACMFQLKVPPPEERLKRLLMQEKACAAAADKAVARIRGGKLSVDDAMSQCASDLSAAFLGFLPKPTTMPASQREGAPAFNHSMSEGKRTVLWKREFLPGTVSAFVVGSENVAMLTGKNTIGVWNVREHAMRTVFSVRDARWEILPDQLCFWDAGEMYLAMRVRDDSGQLELVVYDVNRRKEYCVVKLASVPLVSICGFTTNGRQLLAVSVARGLVAVDLDSAGLAPGGLKIDSGVGPHGFLLRTKCLATNHGYVMLFSKGAVGKDEKNVGIWTFDDATAKFGLLPQPDICDVNDLYDRIGGTIVGINAATGKVEFKVPASQPSQNYVSVSSDGGKAAVLIGKECYIEAFLGGTKVALTPMVSNVSCAFDTSGMRMVMFDELQIVKRDEEKSVATLARKSNVMRVYDSQTGARLYEVDMGKELEGNDRGHSDVKRAGAAATSSN